MSTIYCTYLTCYSGNKLPPFYIGYSTINKIENGYKGSVSSKRYKKVWKQELRDNPHLFKTYVITKHETRQEATDKEIYLQKHCKVIHNELYINRAIGKHWDNTGNKYSEECRARMSQERKGKPSPNKGRKYPNCGAGRKLGSIPWNKGKKLSPMTEEHRKKISESMLLYRQKKRLEA